MWHEGAGPQTCGHVTLAEVSELVDGLGAQESLQPRIRPETYMLMKMADATVTLLQVRKLSSPVKVTFTPALFSPECNIVHSTTANKKWRGPCEI